MQKPDHKIERDQQQFPEIRESCCRQSDQDHAWVVGIAAGTVLIITGSIGIHTTLISLATPV